jgi:RNase P subunit RPR2
MKKRHKVKRSYPKGQLYCMDCQILLDPELTAETKRTMKELEMPNMLIFCDRCRGKFKNRVRRIWGGFRYLFE